MDKWSFQEYPEHDDLCIEKKDSRDNQVTSFESVTFSERVCIVFVSSVNIVLL